MPDYALTEAEKATLDSLREKGMFGLEWEYDEKEDYGKCVPPREWWDSQGGRYCTDEQAHALAIVRGLKELGEKWDEKSSWFLLQRLSRYMDSFEIKDMLAALIAALEDKL